MWCSQNRAYNLTGAVVPKCRCLPHKIRFVTVSALAKLGLAETAARRWLGFNDGACVAKGSDLRFVFVVSPRCNVNANQLPEKSAHEDNPRLP